MNMKWDFSESMEEMLKNIEKIGGKAPDVVVECIKVGQQYLFDGYKEGLLRHKDDADAIDSLDMPPPEIDGNIISGEVGSFGDKNLVGYFHAYWQEFGAHTRKTNAVTFNADPWKRPVDALFKKKYRKMISDVMKRRLGG